MHPAPSGVGHASGGIGQAPGGVGYAPGRIGQRVPDGMRRDPAGGTEPSGPPPSAPAPAPALLRWRPRRAIIGDEIRVPILWCEFGKCIRRYTDDAAHDERDLRDRALAAGWRYDALGHLACPTCAQRSPSFRS
jgi:hypothetical protein